MKKILFLYTELADYFVNCLNLLAQDDELELHLLYWPIKSEAPFQFVFHKGISVYQREKLSDHELLSLTSEITPDLIFCSGWQDKAYLKVAKHYHPKVPVISAMDNHWFGKTKQWIAKFIAPLTLHRYFTHIWVPGQPQAEYAKKLGFKDSQILTGFYVANKDQFSTLFKKRQSYPKKFIFIGRYIELKGIYDLWQAFTELKHEYPNEWTLTCLGTGSDWDQRVSHPDISHIGFVQPSEMSEYILNSSVFILPSHFEPWGVAVHEMAYAGLPLICSSAIGSASRFLEPGSNGFSFTAGSIPELKLAMKKIIQLDEKSLVTMSKKSHEKALSLSPEMWVKTIKDLL